MSQSKLRLSSKDEGLELSREEYAEADFEPPWRYERAQGSLVVMVPVGWDHHVAVEPFRDYLGAYRLAHLDVVERVFQESWTAVGEDTDRIPDLAVYLRGSRGPAKLPDRIPDLILEAVSQSRCDRHRDYVEKRQEYEQIGVREYVIIDCFEHKMTVLRVKNGRYDETVLGPHDIYSTPLLPGLEIPLKGIISTAPDSDAE